MGDIPSVNNMVTSLITSPVGDVWTFVLRIADAQANGAKIKANSDIDVAIAQTGLDSGSFTDAQATYYSGPQQLNKDGQVFSGTWRTEPMADVQQYQRPHARRRPGTRQRYYRTRCDQL